MIVLKHLKDIYSGKNLYKQITIFSILGIMTIVLNNYAASFLGNIFTFNMGFAPSTQTELYFDLFLGILLLLYSMGYFYKFVNESFSTQTHMPEVSLDAYYILIKMIPMILIWFGYLLLAAMLGFCIFRIGSPLFCIYYSILICIIPFISIILFNFANGFKYTFSGINPFSVIKIMDKTLGNVMLLTVETLILSIIPVLIVWLFFHYAPIVKDEMLGLSLRLGGICVGVYFAYIIQIIYAAGLIKIAEQKLK